MCYLRRKFAEQFADFTVADRIHIGETGAIHFDNISAEDVNLFHLKQTGKSLLFFSETMDVRLAVPSKPSSQPIWLKV